MQEVSTELGLKESTRFDCRDGQELKQHLRWCKG